VELGGLTVAKAEAAVLDLNMFSKASGESIDGIAGMALFEEGRLVLDFPRREVRLEQGDPTNGAQTVLLPCSFEHHLPVINLEIAGEKVGALIDSGFDDAFMLPKSRRLRFVSPPVTVSLAANAADVTEEKAARLATNVIWGGVIFERPIIRISHTSSALIGRKVLEHFVVGLDQRRQWISLAPATNQVAFDPAKSVGLALLPEERGLKVFAVLLNTDAARAGIHRGDYVLAINSQPAKEWSQKRLRVLRDQGESFEVEIVSGARHRNLVLKVSTLVE